MFLTILDKLPNKCIALMVANFFSFLKQLHKNPNFPTFLNPGDKYIILS